MKLNKMMAAGIMFAFVTCSLQAGMPPKPEGPAPKPELTPEAKAKMFKPDITKLISAATSSLDSIKVIVEQVVAMAKLKDDKEVAPRIRAMLPKNLKTAKNKAQAFKEFVAIAPKLINPVVEITDKILNIIQSFGDAVINPNATITVGKGENQKVYNVMKTFDTGLTTISAILKASDSLLKMLPALPAPTPEQAEKAEKAAEAQNEF